ncbi:MAG TPA: PAS domain S-box protein, partial [Candidatus Obscuribacterales bacterium]
MNGPNQLLKRSCCCSTNCSRNNYLGQRCLQDANLLQVSASIWNSDLLNLLPVGVFHLNTNGEFLAVSDRWAEMTGLSAAAVQGRLWTEVVHPSDRAEVQAAWQHALQTNSPFQSEYRWQISSAPTVWVLGQLVAQKSAAGDILSYIGTITDITTQKQLIVESQQLEAHLRQREQKLSDFTRAEAALRESEERYRQLVELCPDAIFIQQGGKFLFLNPAAVQLYGATCVEDLIGTSVLERVHPDYRASVQDRIRQIQQSQIPVPVIEQKLCCLDGRVVDVEVTAIALAYQGEPAIQVVLRDITARKQAEAASRLTDFSFECSSIAATWIRPDASIARV